MEVVWHMNEKQKAAQKIIKFLAILHNYASSPNEKASASSLIEKTCREFNLRIEGQKIIDIDIEEANKRIQFEKLNQYKPPLEETVDPEQKNIYVLYKGKKYYGGVPRSVYIKDQIAYKEQR
jgi:hypothetical protein